MPIKPPAAVRDAIAAFVREPARPFVVKPREASEKSLIFDWGVRVLFEDGEKTHVGWICMADDTCRSSNESLILLSAGRTSKATKHLRLAHRICSDKTDVEQSNKRSRDDEIDRLRNSAMHAANPQRLRRLLETIRIVNNNLPIGFAETRESRVLDAISVREEMRQTLNAECVTSSIIELYDAARREATSYLTENHLDGCSSLSMMTDFWTCKVTHRKFLGLRVYLVDNNWQFRSVLLGTRLFRPAFGDRDAGIEGPFRAWIDQLLDDFDLDKAHFFGATSDSGSEVKKMLGDRLGFQWEWCMAHMVHAATKEACAENDLADSGTVSEDGIVRIMGDVKKTIYQVKVVEKAGDLFEALCKSHTSGKSVSLIGYQEARFLSMAEAIRRILDKWSALEEWYKARGEQEARKGKRPPVFLLANDRDTLTQILSVITAVTTVKRLCQAEKCNQVEVLLSLYMARMHTLDSQRPLKHYLSTREDPRWILPHELSQTTLTVQRRLREGLDKRFFKRYVDPTEIQRCAYIFEMQARLHPTYKRPENSLNRIIRICTRSRGDSLAVAQRNIQLVNEKVTAKLRERMLLVDTTPAETVMPAPVDHDAFSNELIETFAPRPAQQPAANRARDRVEEEMRRWMDDPAALQRSDTHKEDVLSFWHRMEMAGEYRLLPKVARILFAVPSSSAQIERDFGVSGMMVTTQRGSLAGHTIDMASFLNRNRRFVDPEQCPEIARAELHRHIPSHTVFPLNVALFDDDGDGAQDMDGEFLAMFSHASVDES